MKPSPQSCLSLVLLLSLLTACAGPSLSALPQPTPVPSPVAWPVAGWPSSTPEAQGMDSAVLADMLEAVQQERINMHAILVIRNGAVVLESYANPYTAQTPHQIASVTKSVIGALVGIALEQGKIKSYRQKVLDFFPGRKVANLDDRKKAMTLEHLLMLAPGLDCSDIQGTEAEMMSSEDWVQFVLDLPMKTDPGKQWVYCSSAVHLVSAILTQATGMDARSYANQYLFGPIGIQPVPPERWYTDPQGNSGGGNGLMLTPSELARFAYLYLNGGRWGDQQVVPARWVAASLTPHSDAGTLKEYGDMPRSYGYLWSLYPGQGLVSALGRNGQHIHFVPEENLIVIFNSATPVVTDERQFHLLKDFILPAVRSKSPLPENAEASARLTARIEDAAWPRRPAAVLPDLVRKLNGRTIRIQENPYGWESLAFLFREGEPAAQAVVNDAYTVQVGLDNLYRVQDLPGAPGVGFKAAFEDDHLLVRQIMLGTWNELEISIKVEGDKATLFQRNLVDGGSLVRMEGTVE